jgi:hypothetical protein
MDVGARQRLLRPEPADALRMIAGDAQRPFHTNRLPSDCGHHG